MMVIIIVVLQLQDWYIMQQSLLLILAGFFVIVVSTRNEAIDTCTDVPLNRGASCEHVDVLWNDWDLYMITKG